VEEDTAQVPEDRRRATPCPGGHGV
jgi:hypothetical protein